MLLLLPVFFCCLLSCGTALAADEESPGLNDGKKWRVAYYQGGSIPFYTNIQKEIIKELMRKGWIDDAPLPPSWPEAEPPYWSWLCDEATSRNHEFLPENGYSAFWNSGKHAKLRRELHTDEGLRYSYMETVEKIAADQGFELNRCEVLDTTDEREKSRESCLSCYRELAADSDAVFITALLYADEEIDALAALLKKEKIYYSYSFFGSEHVKKGILLGASAEAAYERHGRHYAANIIEVLSGTRPGDLAQVVELPFVISINRSTAEAIGYDIPQSIITIARGINE